MWLETERKWLVMQLLLLLLVSTLLQSRQSRCGGKGITASCWLISFYDALGLLQFVGFNSFIESVKKVQGPLYVPLCFVFPLRVMRSQCDRNPFRKYSDMLRLGILV